ncbi:LysE family transporter [Flavobacteriaceae bacterium]|jgi:threonine/homoserine/homoserine lactone efflux protein|nr:LysE family transporter [Flavobacteriaceae bacterium]
MHLIVLFLYCFLWSFFGVLPPGILNINAAKISVEQGKRAALMFTLGACLIIAVQAGIAVLIAEFLNLSSEELSIIQKIGIAIFFCLSIYFFISAKVKSEPKRLELKKKKTLFFKGLVFSILNVFPIPFYSFVCTTLSASENFNFSTSDVIVFILAIVIGSFMAISTYIVLFKRSNNSEDFGRNTNYVLSFLALILAIFSCVKLSFF